MQIYKEMQGNDFLSQDSNYFLEEGRGYNWDGIQGEEFLEWLAKFFFLTWVMVIRMFTL